jgi:chromosome segregation ATPase
MKTNINELKEWQSNARRMLCSKQDAMMDEIEQIGNYMRAMDVTDELCAEIENLNDQLADKQAEIDDLMAQLEQKQAEIDSLRGELLDAREQNLEAGCNQKPTEIHNHFEQGCSAQVFNDKVTGRFTKKRKEKKKWKKLVRKML